MNIRPLQDVLIVELEETSKVTSGGIIRPDNAPAPLRIGRVVAAGPGRPIRKARKGQTGMQERGFRPTEVSRGDRVVFFAANLDTKQGRQLCYNLGDNIGLIRETDVLFAVEPGVNIEVDV